MQTELEVKILDVDPQKLEKQLLSLGAQKISTNLQRRYVYDVIPPRSNAWIRLRDNGKKSTLTIKEIIDDSITGTKEIEVVVDDFERTNELLNFLGFQARAYQENKRISFSLKGAQIEIDSWPKIPSYLEIEAANQNLIKEIVGLLGYKMEDTTSVNTEKVYGIYGLNIHDFKELRFD